MPRRGDREYPSHPIVGVGGVVLVSRKTAMEIGCRDAVPAPRGVLLVRRRFEPLAGHWSLPGGAIELGETLQAGLKREIAEETGLTVDVGPVLEVFDRISCDGDGGVRYHYVLVDYLCRARGGRLVAASDVSEVAIADPADLGLYRLTDKATAIITRAIRIAEVEAQADSLQYDGAP